MKYITGIVLSSALFWIFGSYVDSDWLWFAHIGSPAARTAALLMWLAFSIVIMSCPMIFPWNEVTEDWQHQKSIIALYEETLQRIEKRLLTIDRTEDMVFESELYEIWRAFALAGELKDKSK